MNEPQKEVPASSDSSHDETHPAQEPVGDDDGTQAGWGAAAPAPDLDDPDDHAQDNDATDSPNT
jgi:hypothetical protein